ncbi:5137_t:CDS:1 [Paraglomus brasilianum]|uniref:5137_t:CDS:1 n=1 Tax=Paraglomus brasilianum TaxID=144538 RepID=A0A9N8VQJ5_9GLOM|nr:5137_t:CDS:1 [Paraglomus brasilianum]
MSQLSKNEQLLLSQSSTAIPIPKIALGSSSHRSEIRNNLPSNKPALVPQLKFNTNDARIFTQAASTGVDIEQIIEEENEREVNEKIENGREEYTSDEEKALEEIIKEEERKRTKNELPSLDKVLSNESGAPLSLYNFYAYLREAWQAEDNLNAWLDIVTHEAAFKRWVENEKKKKSEATSNNLNSRLSPPSSPYRESYSGAPSVASEDSTSHAMVSITPDEDQSVVHSDRMSGVSSERSAEIRITEDSLNKSAKEIYRKYASLNIFPEENKKTMYDLIERQGRYNPVVFATSKAYVYHIMSVVYFPKFIQSAVETNLTAIHAIIALPLGIVALTGGISLILFYIFQGSESRLVRLWGFIPIWFGWMLLQIAATRFAPPLVLFKLSEHKLFRFHRIKEKGILKAHRKKAMQLILCDTVVAIFNIILLIAIPPMALYEENKH